jgi:hypothetical protein
VSAGVTAGSSGTMEKAQAVVDEIVAAGGEAIPDGVSLSIALCGVSLTGGDFPDWSVEPCRGRSLSSRT